MFEWHTNELEKKIILIKVKEEIIKGKIVFRLQLQVRKIIYSFIIINMSYKIV